MSIDMLQAIFADAAGRVEVRTLPNRQQAYFRPSDSDALRAHVERQVAARQNVYFGCATRDGKGGRKENVVSIPCLWTDIDFKDTPEAEAQDLIVNAPLEPSMMVHSGGGFHLYWLLKGPVGPEKGERVENLLRRLAAYYKADASCAELARILRVPGTLNFKPEYGQPRPVQLVSCQLDRRYLLDDFEVYPEVQDQKAVHTVDAPPPKTAPGQAHESTYGRAALADELAGLRAKQKGERNAGLNEAAFSLGQLIGGGVLDRGQVERELSAVAHNIGLEAREIASTIRSGIEAGLKEPRTPKAQADKPRPAGGEPEPRPTGRPEIQVRDGGLPALVDDCETLLMSRDLPEGARVFQRGGQLVRVAVLPASGYAAGVSRPTGAAMIVPVDRVYLQDLLGRLGRFTRYDRRRKAWVETDMPKAAAEALLARKGMWRLPILRGVISCPTLRPDGSLLAKPGYDQRTGYFLAGELKASIPDAPSRDDTLKALESLRALLAGFAFVDQVDQSVALALMLTAIARPALDSTPIFNVTAPVRGSGKSTLVDIAAVLATGRRSAVLSATADPAELEKRLVGCLLSGDALVSLDNINGQLASDLLCQASTAEAVKLRPLGASAQVEVENTTLWTANGNNLALAGDLARRALLCRLDPGMERPEERTFDFDPVALARENRQVYVGNALTVLRAYIVARRPDMGLTPFGSFDRWASLVRSALVWAGSADPCASRAAVLDEDPELARLRAVLTAWWSKFGRTPRNVREVLNASKEEGSGLADALEDVAGDGRGNILSQKLEIWLRRNMGRIAGGLKLQRFGNKYKSAEWQVVQV